MPHTSYSSTSSSVIEFRFEQILFNWLNLLVHSSELLTKHMGTFMTRLCPSNYLMLSLAYFSFSGQGTIELNIIHRYTLPFFFFTSYRLFQNRSLHFNKHTLCKQQYLQHKENKLCLHSFHLILGVNSEWPKWDPSIHPTQQWSEQSDFLLIGNRFFYWLFGTAHVCLILNCFGYFMLLTLQI